MTKIAIIGAGIVGSTAAFYLSKAGADVTVFDDGVGQATKAAAGIISPWFSRRRNKAWYKMARLGADFYQQLLADLKKDGHTTDFYDQSGIILLKSRPEYLEELQELAQTRREESPLIGELEVITLEESQKRYPDVSGFDKALYASGAAHVDGQLLVNTLLFASGFEVTVGRVSLAKNEGGYLIDGQVFDQVILACGAWTAQLLEPLGYHVDVRPQKGQLRDYFLPRETGQNPVIMPEGEIDVIPFAGGKVSVGASHENDKGFDLTVEEAVLADFGQQAHRYFPALSEATHHSERVGIRAYTSDFSPFYGEVPGLEQVYVASGLGSSGLTTGPLIGYELAQAILGNTGYLDASDYPVARYINSDKTSII